MKVYYFVVIAVGIMALFYLAGIETSSSKVMSAINGFNSSGWDVEGTSGAFWVAIALMITGAVALSGAKISLGVVSYTGSIDAVIAVFIGAIYGLFISDLISIVTLVNQQSGTGWMYWTVWSIIIPLVIGVGISCVEFIRGND